MKLSVDYFRITCPSSVGYERIRDCQDVLTQERKKAQGFGRVESIARRGGLWYRRSEPHQESREWGLGYESWEAQGFVTREDVAWWIGRGRCTRLDVTADFPGSELRPIEIRDMIRRGQLETTVQTMRLIDGEGGANDGQTLYLGSRESPRMVRIYEKGKQLGNDEPMLRVEVELKEHLSASAFEACQVEEVSYRDWIGGHWRTHLERVISGPLVRSWAAELPSADLRLDVDDLDPWRTLTALATQYGEFLRALHRAGMLIEFVENLAAGSRLSQRRSEKKVETLASDLERVIAVAANRGVR